MAIYVGTCNWADHTPFYPPTVRPSDRLSYYARYFDLVEVDSTFYALQPARNFELWAQRTPERFVFDVKAFRQLTWHDRDHPPDRPTFSRFREALQPLREAGKLRAILFQFPPWFAVGTKTVEFLRALPDLMPGDLLAIEFRHRGWLTEPWLPKTLNLLRELNLVYVMVDEPQIGSGSVPKVVAVTNPELAIARFHGRNTATWYKKVERTGDRFNYLYSRDELAEWVPDIRTVADQTREVHVLMNNNQANYAVHNAQDFKDLLDGTSTMPEQLPLWESA